MYRPLKPFLIVLLSLLVLFFSPTNMQAQSFIQTNGSHFQFKDQPYYYLGTNFWYGMNLGSKGPGGNRKRLLRELDRFQEMGITNLRIMAASEGPDSEPWRMTPSLMPEPGVYNEEVLDGLDFLISEMGKRNIHAVVCLNNFWAWTGGMAQYVNWLTGKPIPYPNLKTGKGWTKYSFYTSKFYKYAKAKQFYQDHIRKILLRKNPYTGLLYKDDPTIMSWQLCNEPRAMLRPHHYRRWISETAAFIKLLDPNHLISIGSEGKTPYPVNNRFRKVHEDVNVDYFTMHLWVQNWQWYDPQNPEKTFPKALNKATTYFQKHLGIANESGKPIVLEEFGISRDLDNHDAKSTTHWRDKYYELMFHLIYEKAKKGEAMAGCNFWAWGGEGRPATPKSIWNSSDDFVGDPPHEYQGWYSVYHSDTSTIQIIQKYAKLFAELNQQ